eukprot:TRINITY_DN5545_c0_g1_i1.p1 TRINITY_DN5545_c0_g1~~TRINITY_DN5545_c0_g1_i1.p1  ORF type:complete len:317 (-),score=43.20 TRINITY_DN5545_c0_g1_i1:531-1481(-)
MLCAFCLVLWASLPFVLWLLLPALAQLVIDETGLSLDRSTITEIRQNTLPVQASFDLHWRLALPIVGDVTMTTKGITKLSSEASNATSVLRLLNPTPADIWLRPMQLSLFGPRIAGYQQVLQQDTSELHIPPGGPRELPLESEVRFTDAAHATRMLLDMFASGTGSDATVKFNPDITFFRLFRWRLHVAKTVDCKVLKRLPGFASSSSAAAVALAPDAAAATSNSSVGRHGSMVQARSTSAPERPLPDPAPIAPRFLRARTSQSRGRSGEGTLATEEEDAEALAAPSQLKWIRRSSAEAPEDKVELICAYVGNADI